MTVNVPLLRKTLEHIEVHPEEWDQEVWRCATSACFAGHAVDIMGGQWIESTDSIFVLAEPEDDPSDVWANGFIPVPDRARRLLGISIPQSARLFNAGNTLDDLRRVVGELIDGAS